jgi:phosphoribosylformylglycinamidine synthase
MIKANIYVSLKSSVLDPQGKMITETMHQLDFKSIIETRCTKLFIITIDEDDLKKAEETVEMMCKKILANPNTETYRFELEKI